MTQFKLISSEELKKMIASDPLVSAISQARQVGVDEFVRVIRFSPIYRDWWAIQESLGDGTKGQPGPAEESAAGDES